MLVVVTKDIVLASQALLILCAIRKGQTTVLSAQALLILCVQSPKISTAVLMQATTCAGCSSLANFVRTPARN